MTEKASIKETGEEVSQEDWKRFEAAVEGKSNDARRARAAEPSSKDLSAENAAAKTEPVRRS